MAARGNDEFRRCRCQAQPNPFDCPRRAPPSTATPADQSSGHQRVGGIAHGDPGTRIKHPFRRVCGQHCLRRSAAELAVPTQASAWSCHTETLAYAPALALPALTASS